MLFKIQVTDNQDSDGKQLSSQLVCTDIEPIIYDRQPVRSDIALDQDWIEEKR